MTDIGNGGQDGECLEEVRKESAPPKKIIQRLASERDACAFVDTNGKRCGYLRVNLDDPNGRCLLPEHK